ncbi:EscT/YscT/HrcT family type III secretion system export apparatus protein [Janthinobacterium agaricidamnosum]|nr:flagellar biosynthetic protein FliR [Janthinobacterium agaricidamnosum]
MPHSLLLEIQSLLIALALTLPRIAVCLAILPGFGAGTLTMVMRGAVAFALALPAVVPAFASVNATPPGMLLAGMLSFKEAAIGGMLGLTLAVPVWVVQSIGSILDAQRSPIQLASNNASFDHDASAIGAMLVQAVMLVLIQAGLFTALTRILIESYGMWPVMSLSPPFDPLHLDVMIQRFSEFVWHIVVYGGPLLIPLVMVDFGFAIIGVFASNLQVSFAAAPIKSLAGMFILLIYWPTLSYYVAGDFSHILDLSAILLGHGT